MFDFQRNGRNHFCRIYSAGVPVPLAPGLPVTILSLSNSNEKLGQSKVAKTQFFTYSCRHQLTITSRVRSLNMVTIIFPIGDFFLISPTATLLLVGRFS